MDLAGLDLEGASSEQRAADMYLDFSSPGLESAQVARLIDEDRVLQGPTLGELAFHRGLAHAGIVRIVDHPIARHPATVSAAIQRYGADLLAGALVTVEPGRVRVRPA